MTIKKISKDWLMFPEAAAAYIAGQEMAEVVNGLVDGSQVLRKTKKPRIMLIGDSLTGSGTNPLASTGLTYKYSSGISQLAGWIPEAELDSSATGTLSGQLRTEGDGKLQFAFNGDSYGEKVDVTSGGFFELISANGVKCFVKIVKSNQPSSVKEDTLTFLSIKTNLQVGGLNTYAEYLKASISKEVDIFNAGIIGDTIEGLETRWLQAYELFKPDFIAVMIGTNNQPANNNTADQMFNRMKSILQQMLDKVDMVFVGGLFPRGDLSASVSSSMQYYSKLLENLCSEENDLLYWDAFPSLIDSNTVGGGSIKNSAFHTDNLHLMPFGARLAAKALQDKLLASGLVTGYTSHTRGVVSNQYSLNPNPLFLGAGGTGSGSNGVTGTVPASTAITRTGGAQALALSQESNPFSQNVLILTSSGSTDSNNYHEVTQSVTIPSELVNNKFKIVISAELKQATNLRVLEFAVIGSGNSFGAYLNQGSRVISNIDNNIPYKIDYVSDPFYIPSGTTSAQIRVRVGNNSGGTTTLHLREFSLIAV